jgi:hypothetical protein
MIYDDVNFSVFENKRQNQFSIELTTIDFLNKNQSNIKNLIAESIKLLIKQLILLHHPDIEKMINECIHHPDTKKLIEDIVKDKINELAHKFVQDIFEGKAK